LRDRCTRRTLFGQRATCFPVGRRQVRKFARTAQPTLDKTENSIAGLGPNVQRNRNTVNPQGIRHGPHREPSAVPVKCASSKIHSIPKMFKHPRTTLSHRLICFSSSYFLRGSISRTTCIDGKLALQPEEVPVGIPGAAWFRNSTSRTSRTSRTL
jgi:hypothetical protein